MIGELPSEPGETFKRAAGRNLDGYTKQRRVLRERTKRLIGYLCLYLGGA